jgi:hypothetical protein
VHSFDVVTADGELRHVDAESEPELFWALRGGKGNFGVVTVLEFALFPVPRLYGGAICFPVSGWPTCCAPGPPGTRAHRRPSPQGLGMNPEVLGHPAADRLGLSGAVHPHRTLTQLQPILSGSSHGSQFLS